MSIEELLEQLDEALEGGLKMPGNRRVVNAENLRVVIDEIRLNIPSEIKQARGIVADRADIITNAKREADGIIRSAEERANAMITQEAITKLAQEKASEIIANAQAKSREMRKAAQEFVDDIMRRADEGLTANLGEIRKTRASLKSQVPHPAAKND
ncbi:MAG: ATP synthase F0 subunit B [Ruminococcaceae bacterium]|mgnify:CR=1 FL=1|nr:ATP synthase F0 subunit B [Oscillospiraceae bacterium]